MMMIKKISTVLAVIAALGQAGPSVIAKPMKKNVHISKSVHVNRNVHVNRHVTVHRSHPNKYIIGRTYNGHVWYGRHRHRWRGRWYDYGVGPCWINIGGLWFWNTLLCP